MARVALALVEIGGQVQSVHVACFLLVCAGSRDGKADDSSKNINRTANMLTRQIPFFSKNLEL
jgi:hypothetical protein